MGMGPCLGAQGVETVHAVGAPGIPGQGPNSLSADALPMETLPTVDFQEGVAYCVFGDPGTQGEEFSSPWARA